MEPITTAALITGLVKLGKMALNKASEKLGDEAVIAAKECWPKVKSLLGFAVDPPAEKLDAEIGKAVYNKPEVHEQLQQLLEDEKMRTAALVGSVHVGKGIANVIGQNSGPINMHMDLGKD